jgi:hypothetical protein
VDQLISGHEQASFVRHHVHDAGLSGSLELAGLVSLFNSGFDFFFALAFGTLLLGIKPAQQRGRAALRIETGGLEVEWILPVDEAREAVASVSHF